MKRRVSVIIATAARAERATALRRAIDGVCALEPAPEVIVVVNGTTYDPALLQALRTDPRVRCDYLDLGSYPAAQRRGRELVSTEFFCFLDDDDELLEGSLSRRIDAMSQPDQPDIVVSSGLCRVGTVDTDNARLPAPGADLMLDLLHENWFASPAALFRCATVGLEFFDGQTKYYEWTLLGFRLLAEQRRFVFIPQPGYRLHDSPASLSKNPAGILFTPELLGRLLVLGPTPAARKRLRRRLANAHHACADLELEAGNLRAAWQHHVRSLCLPGGLSFLAFTRRLLRSAPGAPQ